MNTVNTGNAGKGRPKGSKNKNPLELKEMTFSALSRAGGEDYLVQQALENPKVFLSFLGRFIPSEVRQTVTTTVSDMTDEELDAKIQEKLDALNG